MDGFFPKEIVVFNVPVESWRETTGDRAPLGDDFGEYCSTFRNWSAIIIFPHRFLQSQLHKTAPTGAQWCHLCYWGQFIKSRMIDWSQKTEHGKDQKMQQGNKTLFEWNVQHSYHVLLERLSGKDTSTSMHIWHGFMSDFHDYYVTAFTIDYQNVHTSVSCRHR